MRIGIARHVTSLMNALLLPALAPSSEFEPRPSAGENTGELLLIECLGADRIAAESFIKQRYAQTFGARVSTFMPRLFTLCDAHGAVRGAFGLRSAHHRLFTERYLDRPIEAVLAQATATSVARQSIIEVGHSCGAFAGSMRSLIRLLASHLDREGFEWVVFTSTGVLRNAFARVGLNPLDLGPASITRLPPDERAAWGRYYDHAPRVSAGRIETGMRAFAPQRKKDVR
jgi:hypothetical protein